jgi:hypothetical protein
MFTNAGTKEIHLKGMMPGFGEAWFDSDMMANIIGFSSVADKHRIYDSDVNDAFVINTNDGPVEFVRRPDGLYRYTPSIGFKAAVAKTKDPITHLQTGREVSSKMIANTVGQIQLYVANIKESIEGFTAKEINAATIEENLEGFTTKE